MHGGASTGARTLDGIERIRKAVSKHGRYSEAARVERLRYRKLVSDFKRMLKMG
jgi:hypothetical protein